MNKMGFTAFMLAAVLGLSSCGMAVNKPVSTKEEEKEEKETVQVNKKGKELIVEAGDMSVGPETESEESIMYLNETESETETEKESAAGKNTASSLNGSGRETVQTESEIESETETEMQTEVQNGPIEMVVKDFLAAREAMGEHWSVGYEDLEDGTVYGYHDEDVMQSASVVKLFIMGAVYRYMCYPKDGEEPIPFHEQYDGHLKDTIVSMITVSDNDCANLLIERLGEGDFHLGAERIAAFCKENGYPGTSVGRRFLESNPSGDNYTTAADTRKFLSDLYHGTLVNEEASKKMLDIVMGQTRKNKIPSGLPAGFTSGNKTGEMPEGYGLGCIENDSAIIFPPEGQGKGYILTIMSNDLGGRNSEAISLIGQISSKVAQWYLEDRASKQTEGTAASEVSSEVSTEAASETGTAQ